MIDINKQSRIINFFHKQQEKDMVSHAYLLNGKNTKETALYMAMSLFCDVNKVGACQGCSSCLRILDNNHPSVVVLNPDNERIKKEDIISLKSDFSQTALEQRQKRVYIIHEVDKATPSALNSLLKFLEEPTSDITAILSTESLNRVLDTIQSRCLILNLDDESKEQYLKQAIEEAYDENMSKVMLSISEDFEQLKEKLEDKQYIAFYDLLFEFLKDEKVKKTPATLILHGSLVNKLKPSIHEFSEILTMLYTMSTDYRMKEVLVNIQDRIRPGVSVNLLIDQFIYFLLNGKEDFDQ